MSTKEGCWLCKVFHELHPLLLSSVVYKPPIPCFLMYYIKLLIALTKARIIGEVVHRHDVPSQVFQRAYSPHIKFSHQKSSVAQTLSISGKRLIEELTPSTGLPPGRRTPVPPTAKSLQSSLDFAPSPLSMSIVQQFKHSLQQRRKAEAANTARLNAGINEQRTSQTPLLGQDIVQAVRVPRYSHGMLY